MNNSAAAITPFLQSTRSPSSIVRGGTAATSRRSDEYNITWAARRRVCVVEAESAKKKKKRQRINSANQLFDGRLTFCSRIRLYIRVCVSRFFFLYIFFSQYFIWYFSRTGILFCSALPCAFASSTELRTRYGRDVVSSPCARHNATFFSLPFAETTHGPRRRRRRRRVCRAVGGAFDGQPISHALVICHNYLRGQSFTPLARARSLARSNGNGRARSPYSESRTNRALRRPYLCVLSFYRRDISSYSSNPRRHFFIFYSSIRHRATRTTTDALWEQCGQGRTTNAIRWSIIGLFGAVETIESSSKRWAEFQKILYCGLSRVLGNETLRSIDVI